MTTTTPNPIEIYRLRALKSALRLESLGLQRRGPSALSIVRSMGIDAPDAATAFPMYIQFLRSINAL